MAQDSLRWDLRPAWRLAIAIGIGLALTAVALAWPAIVRGDSPPPQITGVEVTSSKGTYFYSPPLDENGGDTYFNNASISEGAGQIITVTVVVSDDNPTTLDGGSAFGITPSTNISTSYGITSTWSVTYTIQAGYGTQPNVFFTIFDADGGWATARISFIQDNTDPVLDLVDVTNPQYDPDGDELNATGNWYRTSLLTGGWSFTATIAETGSGYGTGLATWNHEINEHDQAIAPTYNGSNTLNGTFTDVHTNTDGLVLFSLVVTDRVGNRSEVSPIGLILDGTPPYAPLINYLPDTDSGGDGFDPDSDYYDDPSIDVTWSASTDPDAGSGMGSGVAGYYLDTQSPPDTDIFYTGTTGVVTATGNYSETFTVVHITSVDNVGNVGSHWGYIESTDVLFVRESLPSGGSIDIQEVFGGEYLYISDPTRITEGTLFYNNTQPSAFKAVANTSSLLGFNWGYNTPSWKVVFTPGWGESSADERFGAPYTHTYSIEPPETTDVFTVYFVNRAGNVQSVVIDAAEDTEAPQIAISDVTNSQYDPDGDELDDTGNWYRTSLLTGGWSFTAAITETGAGYGSSLANWDHQVNNANDKAIAPVFNGADALNGTFLGVSNDSDGRVQVTVVVTDHVNNSASDSLAIQLDGTSPSIDPNSWDETSDYLTVQGEVLYFNTAMPGTQTATVSGITDDGTGSGLDRVTYEQKPALQSIPATQITTGDWSSAYGFTSATGEGADSVEVTIYDNVGNLVTHTYEYVGASDPLGVAFDDVTLPGWDAPPLDPLDDIGNWYAAGDLDDPPNNNSWRFGAVITPANGVNIPVARATWEHEAGTDYERSINLVPDPTSVAGFFQAVRSHPSGLVTVTLTITDDVNRVASDTLLIRIDKDGPAISDDGWLESSPYLHADGSTLYFSHMMGTTQQVATLSGSADDGPNGAGSSSVGFSSPESLGPSLPNPSLPDWSIQYFVSASSNDGGSPVWVTTEDNLGNQNSSAYTYTLDITPPSAPTNFTITTPPVTPGYFNTRSLDLSWDSTSDNVGGSGLLGYYLGTADPPTTFYPPMTTTTTWDTAADGTFTFYLAASDNVANTSLTSTGPITIDTRAPEVDEVEAISDSRQGRFLVRWSAEDPAPGTWVVGYDVEYRITDSGVWQTWLPGTSNTSAYFGPDSPVPVEFDTLYCFRVRARDYLSNQGDWNEVCANLGRRKVFLPTVVGNVDPSIPTAVFDGFETGRFVGWKREGALPSSIVRHPVPPPDGVPPDGGTYAARLGSGSYGSACLSPTVPVGRATMQAYAYVPESGTPYLRFDYRVLSYDWMETLNSQPFERLEVTVNGRVLERYGNPNQQDLNLCKLYDSGWKQAEFDLSAYAGKNVLLTFFTVTQEEPEDAGAPPGMSYYNTYSYLDNIRIEVGP